MADYISKKQIVKWREFLINYYKLDCRWKGKMTHKRIVEFLKEQGKSFSKGVIGKITTEQKLNGEYIYVIDDVGNIVAYKNPMLSLERLQTNLIINNKQKLENIRLKILNNQGLTYDEYGNVITIEEAEQKRILEQERKIEEENDKILDMEEAYYMKQSYNNRTLVKSKSDYRYRRIL